MAHVQKQMSNIYSKIDTFDFVLNCIDTALSINIIIVTYGFWYLMLKNILRPSLCVIRNKRKISTISDQKNNNIKSIRGILLTRKTPENIRCMPRFIIDWAMHVFQFLSARNWNLILFTNFFFLIQKSVRKFLGNIKCHASHQLENCFRVKKQQEKKGKFNESLRI